jgi:hypothetical protein
MIFILDLSPAAGEQAENIRRFREPALDGYSFAAVLDDFGDEPVRAFLAEGVAHDDGSPGRCQTFCNISADPFGSTSDDGDLSR